MARVAHARTKRATQQRRLGDRIVQDLSLSQAPSRGAARQPFDARMTLKAVTRAVGGRRRRRLAAGAATATRTTAKANLAARRPAKAE
eukprot:3079796-Pleurochrysis_carterae.AAC.1